MNEKTKTFRRIAYALETLVIMNLDKKFVADELEQCSRCGCRLVEKKASECPICGVDPYTKPVTPAPDPD